MFDAQIKAWDGLIATLGTDPFMKKVMDSQKEWVQQVVYYNMMNATDYKRRLRASLPGCAEDLIASALAGRIVAG